MARAKRNEASRRETEAVMDANDMNAVYDWMTPNKEVKPSHPRPKHRSFTKQPSHERGKRPPLSARKRKDIKFERVTELPSLIAINAAALAPEKDARTACERVLAVTELAEAIFLNLNMGDILCGIIQTCKAWKAVVDESLKPRRSLFLKPVPMPPLSYSLEAGEWVTAEKTAVLQPVYEHPVLTRLDDLATKMRVAWKVAKDYNMGSQKALDVVKRCAYSSWKIMNRPHASWRWALLRQPPVTEVYSGEKGSSQCLARSKTGVLMGDVVPILQARKRTEVRFFKPAERLRGYNMMSGYECYKQLKKLLKTRKKKRLRGGL